MLLRLPPVEFDENDPGDPGGPELGHDVVFDISFQIDLDDHLDQPLIRGNPDPFDASRPPPPGI